MAKQFRVSVIARLRMGVRRQDVESILIPALENQGLTTADNLCWISVPSGDGEMRYVKFSAIVSFKQLDDAWNLRASRQFSEAGYGDVAWKITPVADHDPNAEDTTCSIPNDFFQTWRGDQEGDQDVPLSEPPESFGSDAFWQWFDENVDDPPVGEHGKSELALLKGSSIGNGLRIICASCHRMRDAHGKWVERAFPHQSRLDAGFSHGICPECAKKLYPDYYPE